MNTSEKVKEWFDSADCDIKEARAELNEGGRLYIGSMCHQTIEYALKAIITHVTNREELYKSSDLLILAEKAQLTAKMSNEHLDFIKELNFLHMEASYFEYMGMVMDRHSEEYLHKIVEGTADLLYWIKKQLPIMSINKNSKVIYLYHRTRS